MSPMLPTTTCLTAVRAITCSHGVGEILQHDDRFRAGVLQLMLQLARGVERIDVDHRIAGAQHRGGRDRVLQHVRHHQRDARALLQPLALQVSGERVRHLVEIAIGDRLVHADESLAAGELGEALLEQLDQRGILGGVDIGRHAGRILLEPDSLHGLPSKA